MGAVTDIRNQIEEVKTQIDFLQTRNYKMTEIFIHLIHVKQYPSSRRSAVKTCEDYVRLVKGTLTALQTDDHSVQEIVQAEVKACSPAQISLINALGQDAAKSIVHLHKEMKRKKEILKRL